MKLVIQKVSHASVETEGASIAEIQKGFLVLVGIGKNDTKETIDQYVKKMVNLRIFTDENGKTNLSLKDVNGEILLVSQFTLYANCKNCLLYTSTANGFWTINRKSQKDSLIFVKK